MDDPKETSGGEERAAVPYPCPWTYTIIGREEGRIREAVAEVMGDRSHELSPSNASSGGKYVSMKLRTEVRTEEERDGFHGRLRGHPAVKLVL